MGYLLLRAIVRARATKERAEPLAVASRSSLRLGASSPTQAGDLLAPLPGVMASQALAFLSSAESWALSFATLLHVAGPPLLCQLAEPVSPRRWE
jgi:hypothetical protein